MRKQPRARAAQGTPQLTAAEQRIINALAYSIVQKHILKAVTSKSPESRRALTTARAAVAAAKEAMWDLLEGEIRRRKATDGGKVVAKPNRAPKKDATKTRVSR